MGTVNSDQQRLETLNRINNLKLSKVICNDLQYSTFSKLLYQQLRDYFALCAMARGKSKFKEKATRILFGTRIKLGVF